MTSFSMTPAPRGIKNVQHQLVTLNQVVSLIVTIQPVIQAKTVVAQDFVSNKGSNEVSVRLISNTEIIVQQRIANAVTDVGVQIMEHT